MDRPSEKPLLPRLFLPLGVVALVAACTHPDDTSFIAPEAGPVQSSRKMLVGMNETDIRMCAGFPSAVAKMEDGSEIWSFTKSEQRGGVNFSLPSVAAGPLEGSAGSVSVTGGAYCSMQIHFVNGKAVQVAYAGNNNSSTTLDAYCVPLVDSCVRYGRRGWSSKGKMHGRRG